MKKILAILAVIVIAVAMAVAGIMVYAHFSNRNGQSRISNDHAERKNKNRYLTIINDTDQIINEVHVTVGEGTEIEKCFQKNPDEKTFSIQIPTEYDKYSEFQVILFDRYGLKYQKKVKDVGRTGRKEVKITANNYTKRKGDWKRKLDEFFNKND